MSVTIPSTTAPRPAATAVPFGSRGSRRVSLALVLAAAWCSPTGAEELFPEPFLVEHRLVQHEGGESTALPPVVDRYGGSWVVSERADGSRVVIDLERRKLTEVRSEEGVFSTLEFDRLASLQRRIRVLLGLERSSGAEESGAGDPVGRPRSGDPPGPARDVEDRLVVEEVSPGASARSGSTAVWATGVRKFEVRYEPAAEDVAPGRAGARSVLAPSPLLEAWASTEISLRPRALDALDGWERSLNGGRPADAVAVVRRAASGGILLRTRRPLPGAAERDAVVEDEALRVERLETFPLHLVEVPAGFRQVPHPLELAVAGLETERLLDESGPGIGDRR